MAHKCSRQWGSWGPGKKEEVRKEGSVKPSFVYGIVDAGDVPGLRWSWVFGEGIPNYGGELVSRNNCFTDW